MKSLTEQLAEIKERADKATEGPWGFDDGNVLVAEGPPPIIEPIGFGCCPQGYRNSDADSEFIAHARTDVPKLLAVIEKLKQQRFDWFERCHGLRCSLQEQDAELVKILEGEK